MGLYLIQEGEGANEYLDGACLYATPWDLVNGCNHFYQVLRGIYAKGMGKRLNDTTLHKILPHMKPYLSEEDYKYYEGALTRNKAGLQGFDKEIFPRMFGYKDEQDYYRKCSLIHNGLEKIRVPTFCLGSRDDQVAGD